MLFAIRKLKTNGFYLRILFPVLYHLRSVYVISGHQALIKLSALALTDYIEATVQLFVAKLNQIFAIIEQEDPIYRNCDHIIIVGCENYYYRCQ